MIFAWVLNGLALAFGAGLGGRGFIDPRWASRFARLQPDEQGGGFAEFRSTYGGVFFFSHAAALGLTVAYVMGGEYVLGVAATGAALVLGAAWAGSSLGRLIAIVRDGVRTRFNFLCALAEAGLSAAIAAPWIAWFVF
jgi:hypothetical protein